MSSRRFVSTSVHKPTLINLQACKLSGGENTRVKVRTCDNKTSNTDKHQIRHILLCGVFIISTQDVLLPRVHSVSRVTQAVALFVLIRTFCNQKTVQHSSCRAILRSTRSLFFPCPPQRLQSKPLQALQLFTTTQSLMKKGNQSSA